MRPYAFVRGSDGHLWCNFWDGAQWLWADQNTNLVPGRPDIRVGPGVGAEVAFQRPYAFVKGSSDNQLWFDFWDGAKWNWANEGAPDGTADWGTIGTITVGDHPYIFVRNSAGNLWVNYYDGSRRHWEDLGRPPTATVVGGSRHCVVAIGQHRHAFVRGSDDHLWCCDWDGFTHTWTDHGYAGINHRVGAVFHVMALDQRIYVFVFSTTYLKIPG